MLQTEATTRIHALSHDLALARRRIEQLQRQRRAWPALVTAVGVGLAWASGGGLLRAQAGAAGSGDLAARLTSLEQKLAAIEQGRGKFRGLEIVDAGGATVISLSGASGDGLVAVNKKGGSLGVALSGDGNVGVFSGGKAVAGLKADTDGRGVVTVGREGTRLAVLTTTADGEGQLTLNGSGGQLGAAMSGSGAVGVFDDGKGLASMRVENGIGKIHVGNQQGKRLVTLSPDPYNPNAGSLVIENTTGKPVFRVGDSVKLGDARITIGRGEKGNYGINVADEGGAPLAQLGQAQIGGGVVSLYNSKGVIRSIVSGTGQIHVAGDDGNTLATMVAEAGEGAFSIRNKGGTTIVRIGEGSGGGMLQLADQGGTPMVEGGVFPGRGIVRTYPLGGAGVGLVGMPGTFISGLLVNK